MSLSSDSPAMALLANMVARPAMYWGNSANHLHSFMAFLCGYSMGRSALTDGKVRAEVEDLVPGDFSRFVADYFGIEGYAAGADWMRFVEERSPSDREALQLLLHLRRLYEQKRTATADETPKF
jgi:hypothetical protein